MQGERPTPRTELTELIDQLGRRHYLFQAFRTNRDGPEVLSAVRNSGGVADVLIMFSEDRAVAYRVPIGSKVDVYAPRRVLWWYSHTAVWTLRALLTLAPPGHPDAPDTLLSSPPGLGIPAKDRTPVPPHRH